MTDAEFKMLWALIMSLAVSAQVIPVEKVQALIETAHRADTIMPILDPTAYRDGAHNLDDQVAIAEGFLAFRRAIDQVKERRS